MNEFSFADEVAAVHAAYEQDMAERTCDAAWYQSVQEREEQVMDALKRMEQHTHSREDWLTVVAFCGFSRQLIKDYK